MENLNEMDSLFKQKLSIVNSDIDAPEIGLVKDARKLISKRKKIEPDADDVFSLIATFLNMKIKLYHAVIASICMALVIFYFTRTEKTNNTESNSSQYVSNIASVRSSTVLSSIRTFAVKN